MNQTKLLRWILPLGIAATAAVLWKDLIDAAQSIRFLYLTILAAVIIIYVWATYKNMVIQAMPQIVHWRNPLFICIIVWLTATVISISVALQKSEGYVEVARVAFFLLTFIWVSIIVRINSLNAINISIGFCLVSLILSSIGLKDFVNAISSITTRNSYYDMGNMGNRNLLAIMISLGLPFHLIVFEYFRKPVVRVGLLLNCLLGITVVTLTSSRVGWLGLAVLFLICAIVLFAAMVKGSIKKGQLRKIVPALIFAIIVTAAPVYFLLLKNPEASENTIQRIKSFYDFRSEKNIHAASINERLQIWKGSLLLIKDHPLSGVGAGNWKFHYSEKGLPERSQKGSVVFLQPHNDFLWVFSETGIIGGLAFLSLFIIGVSFIIKAIYNGKTTAIHLTILMGIILYAVHSFFDFPKERPLISFTFACLLGFTSCVKEKYGDSSSLKVARITIGILLTISFFTAWLWTIRIQGELNLKKAISARDSKNLKGMKKYLDKINVTFFESDLTGTPLDWYRSELAYYQGDRKSFKKYSESSIKLNPHQLYNLYNLGSIYYKEGDAKTAIKYWEKAVRIAPLFADASVNLSAAYYNQGNYAKAAEILAKPTINYQNKSYYAIATTVFGRYVKSISDTTKHPEIKSMLHNLSLNAEQMMHLQLNVVRDNVSIRDAALAEAIYQAFKFSHTITKQDIEELKSYYKLENCGYKTPGWINLLHSINT